MRVGECTNACELSKHHECLLSLKDKLQAQFEEMKYSGEERMSSGQRMLEEVQTHLNDAQLK